MTGRAFRALTLMLASGLTLSAQQNAPPFQWPAGKRVALSLSFDDGRASQIEGGAALLDRHGVKATFYVTPAAVETRLDAWKRRTIAWSRRCS